MSGTTQLLNLSLGSLFSAVAPADVAAIFALIAVAGTDKLVRILLPKIVACESKVANLACVSCKNFSKSPAIIAFRCRPKRLISASVILPFSGYKHCDIKPNIGRNAIRACASLLGSANKPIKFAASNAPCCTAASSVLLSVAYKIKSSTLPVKAKILATVAVFALPCNCSKLVFPHTCK